MIKAEMMPTVAAAPDLAGQRIAVLVPCFNEEVAVAMNVGSVRPTPMPVRIMPPSISVT